MSNSKLLIFCLLMLSECFASLETKIDYRFPKNYSLEKIKKIDLPFSLVEVSGLEWVGEDQLWAIQDENSAIYKLDPKSGEILEEIKFGKSKDIEDLMVTNGVAWVLESNGKLYQIKNPFEENQDVEDYPFPIKEKRDFEALLHWESSDNIWVFCKDCSWDDGTKKSSFYPFSIQEKRFKVDEVREMKRKEFRNLPDLNEEKKYKMQPSAAAKHPLRDEIYVISSAGQWLAIYDLEFNLLNAFELSRQLFKQPEGITFDPKGNLYISNEGKGGTANILVFEYSAEKE